MGNGPIPTVRVLNAQGMVAAQAQCSMVEATGMMEDRALISLRTLDEIADLVLDTTIRFGE